MIIGILTVFYVGLTFGAIGNNSKNAWSDAAWQPGFTLAHVLGLRNHL
jgi:hypothetical protein